MIEKVYETVPSATSKRAAKEIVDGVFNGVVDGLCQGGQLVLPGFGTFTVKERPARTCRNPRTGDKMVVPATNVVRFKPSTSFKSAINS